MHNYKRLEFVIGLALLAMGITVMLGWVLRVPIMVQFVPGYVPMVFNTSLCFTLAGVALALPPVRGRALALVGDGLAGFVVLLCVLTLVEIRADRPLGIDWPQLHIWIGDGNVRPGRMAPNTALSFVLIGASLWLLPRVASKWQARLLQILTFAVLALGLTGLVGYALAPDLLYGWARSARMAVHTACCMTLAGVALWRGWVHAPWFQTRSFFREDEKMAFLGAAILLVVTVTAGLTGFVSQQAILEQALGERLQAAFTARLAEFQAGVAKSTASARKLARRPELLALAQGRQPVDAYGHAVPPATLPMLLASVDTPGLLGATLLDNAGAPVAHSGRMAAQPEFSAALAGATSAQLLWSAAPILHLDLPVGDAGAPAGRLVVEVALDALYAQLVGPQGLGTSGEAQLCLDQGGSLLCLPQPRNGDVLYRAKLLSEYGKPMAMSLAVAGRTGLAQTLDYRGDNVIAAYTPLGPQLGYTLKQNTVELYGPIREQFKLVVGVLAVIALAGGVLLRSQLRPLARRLIASEAAASEKEQQIRLLVSSVAEGIITVGDTGRIESFNPAACTLFGYSAPEVLGQHVTMLLPAGLAQAFGQDLYRHLTQGAVHAGGHRNVELQARRKDGSVFLMELTVNRLRAGERKLFVGIVRDITARKETEQELTYLAQNDALTGLPNRLLFMDRLHSALARVPRSGKGMALMFLDLDGFKQVNDTLGHQAGDGLLQQFALRLLAAVRKTDTVARLAGDEFTIILDGIADPAHDARAVADKIIAAMAHPFVLGEHARVVTTSLGLVVHEAGDTTVQALLERADAAMYEAKRSGKNRVAVASWED